MPGKPAPIKKSPAKKAAVKAPEPAPEPAPAPAEAPPAEAPPAEAAPAEAAPAEAAPAEAAPAEAAPAPPAEETPAPEAPAPASDEGTPPEEGGDLTAPAEAAAPAPAAAEEGAAAPAEEAPADAAAAPPAAAAEEAAAAPAEEAPADAAAPAAAPEEGVAAPAEEAPADAAAAPAAAEEVAAAPAEEAPADAAAAPAAAAEEVAAAPAEEAPADAAAAPAAAAEEGVAAPAEEAPADAAAPAAAPEEGVAAPAEEAPADAAPAEAAEPAVVEEPPKAPTPPPPAVPTSPPLDVSVEDVNDSSLTIKWTAPATIGDSGLDGYAIEYCKDGTTDWVAAQEELTPSNRLCIKNLTTGDLLHVRVVAVNPGGRSEPGTLAAPVPIREVADRPKIRMPRQLRARVVKQVGEQINLVIPFLGKPKPAVSWLKDGQPLDTKRVNIRNSDKDTIIFIRQAQREDSGVYEISVKVESFEDKVPLVLQIVELPGPPTSMKLVDSWGFNAALEWTPPKDNGNTEITGYTVQKADKKTGEWFTVLEHYHRLTATVSDLIMGNSYIFRVFTENKVGMSEGCAVTKGAATIQKTDIVYKPPEYPEHDFSEAPKFTTTLSDRAATVGYTTKLLCSVRGCPKPKIEWLKNQMVIGDDPKYRQISNQGICSLEIRKPCSFDGGVYTCRAKNAQGEATVSCKLEVKQIIISEEKGK
ncbi:myosin binding protein Ha isoform X3 [Xyrichtys novacula]|uniref:Myosin-binding protein H n=1 Tax=Xyrichtys novacula TaxID=13765 RepID=A0AAV1HHR5_XYRNO|nr:myosin binding protein Ha isoform X3 [Xyrichtys novacula]